MRNDFVNIQGGRISLGGRIMDCHPPPLKPPLNQAKNVPVVRPSSPIENLGKSVMGFMSYGRTYKQ